MLMLVGTDPLTLYLKAAAERPFQWGEHDCLKGFLSGWVALKRGVEPGAEWSYRTEREARAILKEAGGAVAHLDRCMKPLGIERTKAPKRGDIAIVKAPEGEMGAILFGSESTASLFKRGLLIRRSAPILAAWSI